jgi:uncharacterized RDD family membrane protein YckC
MTEDRPGPPASGNPDDQPGQGATEPLPGPAQPPAYPAGGPPVPPPAYPGAGPPREALEGFWRRLVAAFLDWVLVGIIAAAIGELFGVWAPSPPPGDGNFQPAPGPFVLVALVYFTFFHATTAGQSIGNKIMGMRVLDADTGRSLPYVRAFVRALVSNLSAIVLFLGYLWALWEPRKRTWHDMVANSLVVRAGYYPPGEFGRLPPSGRDRG